MAIDCSITIHLIMSKHAYMIMCHDKLDQLKVLVSLLDCIFHSCSTTCTSILSQSHGR